MNTDFPVIEDPATEVVGPAEQAQPTTALATVRTTILADLSRVEKGLATLTAEHGSTNYDITTPLGYKLATARRYAVRQVRFQIPHVVTAKKAELKDLGKALETEAERITALLMAIETPHDELIKAEDERKEAEAEKRRQAAAEAARIEAERVAKHRANIDKIRDCLTRAQGLPSERIERGITMLSTVAVDGFEEFIDEARTAHLETLAAMTALHRETWARELEAARIEQQRIENERVAAEQKAEAERLAAERAELKRQADELAEQRAEAERVSEEQRQREEAAAAAHRVVDAVWAGVAQAAEQAQIDAMAEAAATGLAIVADGRVIGRDEIMRDPQESTEGQDSQQVLKAEAPAPDATDRDAPATTSPDGGPMGAGQPAAAGPVGVVPPLPDLSINDINDRLGFAVQPALLAALCIEPVKTVRRVPFYRAFQFPAICDALIAHITAAKGR